MESIEQRMAAVLEDGSHISIHWKPSFQVLVRVRRNKANPDFAEFKKAWGGSHTQSKHDGAWWYSAHGRKAAAMLADVKPYLTTKVKHAELCIQLQESVDRMLERENPREKLPREEYFIRMELVNAIKKLNTGLSPEPKSEQSGSKS